MRALLNDLAALERMLDEGRFESGVRRVGAEQEMFLVDRRMRPACLAPEVLARVGDPRLTTEIARFNLEANLTPRLLVVEGGRLVGIVTAKDFLDASAKLFEERLAPRPAPDAPLPLVRAAPRR